MAEIRIPVEKLPAPDQNGDHAFQFRIISVDKNQWSAWSQLYIVKSIGQYRPVQSDYIFNYVDASSPGTTYGSFVITWTTPTIYNSSASLSSASISHNHSQNYNRHATDIFLQFSEDGVSPSSYRYYQRSFSDSVTVVPPPNNQEPFVKVIGFVATKRPPLLSSQSELSNFILNNGDLFKIFETDYYEIPVQLI
jgi:hypothetical protein